MNLTKTRDYLQAFDFQTLFVEELGWMRPARSRPQTIEAAGEAFTLTQIANLGGVVVFEAVSETGGIPPAKTRALVHKEAAKIAHENLIIFVDGSRAQSVWYWVKREKNKTFPRDHYFTSGQPGDLFLSKLSGMVIDIGELDENGNVPVTTAAKRLSDALDVEKITKKFFAEFKTEHDSILGQITGINDDRDRRWYASVLLNRLMFVYFLQRKFFLDNGNGNYLQDKLAQSKAQGNDRFFRDFLCPLFFVGFAKPRSAGDPDDVRVRHLVGEIPYLNGGIFLPHPVEVRWADIALPDSAFEAVLTLFGRYSWNLNDTPNGADDEINPDTLGYIFEKYINQKEFGAYYTRTEITEYLCEQTIHRLILDKINAPAVPHIAPARSFDTLPDLLMALDAPLCKSLLHDVLPNLTLLDPSCGSGAFLVAAMKTLINVYSAVIGRIKFLPDRELTKWLRDTEAAHPSINYFIKREIIKNNLYGVDIMEESTEIAKLRLFLALVASAQTVDQLEPLPNIDFNILHGNSLIGLLHITERDFDERATLFRKSYRQIVNEKEAAVRAYKNFNDNGQNAPVADLRALRDDIDRRKSEANDLLSDMLLDDFSKKLAIKFEQATWDTVQNKEGKPAKRALTARDIAALTPFHWGYEFDGIMNGRGGFDGIITNPPWEIFKPNDKEFFTNHLEGIQKNKLRIEDFTLRKSAVLSADPDVRGAYLAYLSNFPFVSQYYRSSPQFANQISVVNGKKAGTDINLYKLFTEQCYRLLRPGGYCGIVIPSGIYTDLGTKQLRELLFAQTHITGLFCFENRRTIFENVDSRFKFVVLSFEKGGTTDTFPTAFMRHDVRELEQFPKVGALPLSVETIRALSPDSLSITEFKDPLDFVIADKMRQFPRLGEKIEGTWNFGLTREFDMTNDSHLFRTEGGVGRLPLFEGKMIHQFTDRWAEGKYWVDEQEGRADLTKRDGDTGQTLNYQNYRTAHREIAASTNSRTMIGTILPRNVFANHKLHVSKHPLPGDVLLYICTVLNSFAFDYMIRQAVTTSITMFFTYQTPVPRLTAADPAFAPIVTRAARLICTTPAFDDLAREVGLHHAGGATDPGERARLRAELDGIIAHLYGLSEAEFAHILSTFPLVAASVKDAALSAYRDAARGNLP